MDLICTINSNAEINFESGGRHLRVFVACRVRNWCSHNLDVTQRLLISLGH